MENTDKRLCFECAYEITNLQHLMPWGTLGGQYHVWFHFDCFLKFVDARIIELIEYMAEMDRRAGKVDNN